MESETAQSDGRTMSALHMVAFFPFLGNNSPAIRGWLAANARL
jgi:hypothetical protein